MPSKNGDEAVYKSNGGRMSGIEQSVKDRLKNIARETEKDFNFVCIRYMQERFLARLEKSKYRSNFILKGALLLLAYDIPVVRPSKDIDFLGEQTTNNLDEVRSAIRSVAEVQFADGVTFDADDLEVQQITEDAEYGGLRIKISATVGGDFHRLQLDIGFGDIIVDGPVNMDYPSLLEFASPNIKVYSLESAIAEKFEAIVSLGTLGSRMKDYFDVWYLTQNHDIDDKRLQKAIIITFRQRNTPLTDVEYIFTEEFKNDTNKKRQWEAFLNRSTIEIDYPFIEIIREIEKYMKSILNH